MAEHIINVRYYCGTYIARAGEESASATSGAEVAAERLAKKIFSNRPFTLKTITGDIYIFIATEEGKK